MYLKSFINHLQKYYSLLKQLQMKIKMFLLLLLITVVVIITKVTNIHTCIDKSHNNCDGICECDGMECIN